MAVFIVTFVLTVVVLWFLSFIIPPIWTGIPLGVLMLLGMVHFIAVFDWQEVWFLVSVLLGIICVVLFVSGPASIWEVFGAIAVSVVAFKIGSRK